MTVHKKVYIGGKIIHRPGSGILLDVKRAVVPISREVDRTLIGKGLSDVALKRLEALKPRIEIPKRQKMKF